MLSYFPISLLMENREQWVFYLKLARELPKEFFSLDQSFKASGKSLVPVGLKALSTMLSQGGSIHVLIVIKNIDEYKFFKTRVVKMLKYLMRSDKVYLYVASSFSSVNDNQIMRKDHYSFIKIPVATSYLCGSISNMIDARITGSLSWPSKTAAKYEMGA